MGRNEGNFPASAQPSVLLALSLLAASALGSLPAGAQDAGAAGLVQRLQALEEEVRRLRPLEDELSALQRKVASLEERRFESGELVIHADQLPELRNPRGCPADASGGVIFRGVRNGRMNFSKPFVRAPRVVVSLRAFDMGSPLVWKRLNLTVLSIDKDGFNYRFSTWCDTSVFYSYGSWFAFLEDEAPQAQ